MRAVVIRLGVRGQECPRHTMLTRGMAIVLETFREIFDESAYIRFLGLRQMKASRASYAEFLREAIETKARSPRCC